MEKDRVVPYLPELLASIESLLQEGYGEVVFKVAVQSSKITVIQLSKTKSLKI